LVAVSFSPSLETPMRHLILTALLLTASSASAQDLWRMNAAIQNQYNNAYRPYSYGYAPAYRPVYAAPRYTVPRMYNTGTVYGQQRMFEEMNQTNALRGIERNLRDIEFQMSLER